MPVTSPSPFQIMHSMAADREGLSDAHINRETRRRVWAFARPYAVMIAAFVATVIASTAIGLAP
ncbi:MAG: hypothetical protein D6683_15210, partial [Actinomyces sp.]